MHGSFSDYSPSADLLDAKTILRGRLWWDLIGVPCCPWGRESHALWGGMEGSRGSRGALFPGRWPVLPESTRAQEWSPPQLCPADSRVPQIQLGKRSQCRALGY